MMLVLAECLGNLATSLLAYEALFSFPDGTIVHIIAFWIMNREPVFALGTIDANFEPEMPELLLY